MVVATREITSTIRRKATESSSGQTAGSTRAAGRTESSTESEPTLVQEERPSRESGRTERDLDGYLSEQFFKALLRMIKIKL